VVLSIRHVCFSQFLFAVKKTASGLYAHFPANFVKSRRVVAPRPVCVGLNAGTTAYNGESTVYNAESTAV
jgi:hypothetical protein